MLDNLFAYIAVIVTILWFVGILVWCFRRKYGHIKTAQATVVNKQITEVFSKYSGSGKGKLYYVTFQIGNKRRSFKISEFSYNGYRKGESGTLKYRGCKLIDFS